MNTHIKKENYISNNNLNKEIYKKQNDPNYIFINCFFYTFYMKIEDYEKYKIIPNKFLKKN